jgi:hypothetical protein
MKPLAQLPDDEFERLLRAAVALADAPPALLHRAIALWVAQPAAATRVLRRIAAALSFDSWAQPAAAAGVRAPRSATRHLLYSAEGRDIDLRVTPAGEKTFMLAGQVLGPDESGEVELRPHIGEPARHVALDALGEFRFEGLAPSDYRLTLRLGADEVVLPSVPVGTSSG